MKNHATFPFENRAVWLLLSFGLASLIAVLTLMPPTSLPKGPQGMDKVYHILAFAALVFPTAVLQPWKWRTAASLAILFGGLIEILQPAFGRSGSIADLLADALGVGLGFLLGLAVRGALTRQWPVSL